MYHFMVTLTLVLTSDLVNIHLFSEYVRVAYQIKENEIQCSIQDKNKICPN